MEINTKVTEIERKFNIAGGIPLVSIVSGQLRYMAGVVQALAGAAMGLIGLVAQIVRPQDPKWGNITHLGAEHVLHGVLNFIRGVGEMLLGLTLVLPLGLLLCQISSNFKPMVPYELPPQAPVDVEMMV